MNDLRDIWLPLADRFYRAAYYLLESESDAEDAVQELYLKLWSARSSLKDVRNPSAYGLSMLKNICIDRIRRRRETTPKIPDVQDDRSPDRWNDRELVHKALARLPERQRLAVHLKDIEGYSNKELAAILETDETNVRTLLSRGRKALRETIEKEIGYGI